MRLAVCALSAVLLSGCSWLGGGLGTAGQSGFFGQSSQFNGNYGAQGGNFFGAQHNPCVVPSPRAPIPRGCDPASITIGTASGGFPQQPNFRGGSFASGGFGSHAGVAGQQAAHYQPRKRLTKPKFRGSLSLGLEKSISGKLLDHDAYTGLNPAAFYNPANYDEGFVEGVPRDGRVVSTRYTAVLEDILLNDIDFNDAHSTPINIKGGVEYIKSPRTTFFANAGYGYSEGEGVNVASVTGELRRSITTDSYSIIPAVAPIPAIPATPALPGIPGIPGVPALGIPDTPGIAGIPATPGSPGVPGIPEQIIFQGSGTNTTFIPNQNIANYIFDFSNQERVDLEVGARHYFEPVVKDQGFKTLTPFVGASVGATYHNAVSFDVSQNQVFYQRAFDAGVSLPEDFYQVNPPDLSIPSRVDLYDSQWVPTGQLNAGVEWQVTPKTALAFESGVRFEGARDFSNGEKGDTNIAIPVTVRGSYNF